MSKELPCLFGAQRPEQYAVRPALFAVRKISGENILEVYTSILKIIPSEVPSLGNLHIQHGSTWVQLGNPQLRGSLRRAQACLNALL